MIDADEFHNDSTREGLGEKGYVASLSVVRTEAAEGRGRCVNVALTRGCYSMMPIAGDLASPNLFNGALHSHILRGFDEVEMDLYCIIRVQ